MAGKKSTPSFDAFMIEGDGEKAFWTKVGAAWPHDDGKGFNLQMVAIPINGRVALRVPKEREPAERETKKVNCRGALRASRHTLP